MTTAVRTGPATWVAPGVLEIPFNRDLTATEIAGVRQLLAAPTDAAAQWRQQVTDFLALTSPTPTQSADAIRSLSRLVLDLLDRNK
ncbi:MAG: hypothetical protein JWM31_3086 [Solirubrobacterales bacterium]|nr:hypothetical protein [Solirubrobacterales bacterium]